ncbi:MAG: hypothetical protein RLZZ373_3765 [Pseudomonadota bacterium]|jgi:hypothetical protein
MPHTLATRCPSSYAAIVATSIACAALMALSGCAATPAGIEGHVDFVARSAPVLLAGSQPPAAAAQCFEEQARFLPLSEFSRDVAAGTFTYRLRVSGMWFEQVRIAAHGSGSQAEIRLAPKLDARWQNQFDRDRAGVLRHCLGA